VAGLAGEQWNEGDVSDSAVRRVALPGAFFAADGLFETMLTVLDGFAPFPAMIDLELRRNLPFLATTRVLLAAMDRGVGRETAHEVIREHSVAVALRLREAGQDDLVARLAGDARLGLAGDELVGLLADPLSFVGAAPRQVAAFVREVEAVATRYPDAVGHVPAPIL
jgi:adenylosuccinate lyase